MFLYRKIIPAKEDKYRKIGILSNILVNTAIAAFITAAVLFLILPSSNYMNRCITIVPAISCILLCIAFVMRRIFAVVNAKNVSFIAEHNKKAMPKKK